MADTEKVQAEIVAERKAIEEQLKAAEERVRELEARLEEEGRESSDLEMLRQRLTEQMEDERKQHQQDLADRDFTADQTRKKYQSRSYYRVCSFGANNCTSSRARSTDRRWALSCFIRRHNLISLDTELQSQRDTMSRIREENRKLRSDYEELSLRYDDEVYSGGAWKKEKERLETKIQDLTKAYESSTAAQNEQQAQIVALHSQVRELRSVLNDAETDRALLQKARRALQSELDSLKLETLDTGKAFSEAEQAEIKDLLGLYFAEVATRAVDAQLSPRPLATEEMRDWMQHHLRTANPSPPGAAPPAPRNPTNYLAPPHGTGTGHFLDATEISSNSIPSSPMSPHEASPYRGFPEPSQASRSTDDFGSGSMSFIHLEH